MQTITYSSTIEALKGAVKEMGSDFEYHPHVPQCDAEVAAPNCRYAIEKDGVPVPDCIVGHVFARHGVPVEQMVWASRRDRSTLQRGLYSTGDAAMVFNNLVFDGVLHTESAAEQADIAYLLLRVQVKQDGGMSWGDAVREVLERL